MNVNGDRVVPQPCYGAWATVLTECGAAAAHTAARSAIRVSRKIISDQMKKISVVGLVMTAVLVSGCAGMTSSKMTYAPQLKVNRPKKAEDCYDAAVLLGASLERSKEIAKRVLVAVDSSVESETPDLIKAQRNRHIGLFVGSGGEELFISLKPVEAETTYITVATKTGFVGGAGQKAWSCQVVDEMAKMVKK